MLAQSQRDNLRGNGLLIFCGLGVGVFGILLIGMASFVSGVRDIAINTWTIANQPRKD